MIFVLMLLWVLGALALSAVCLLLKFTSEVSDFAFRMYAVGTVAFVVGALVLAVLLPLYGLRPEVAAFALQTYTLAIAVLAIVSIGIRKEMEEVSGVD